ncbi:hypothetical protein ACEXOS_003925 [Herbiconiux sp. P16]|uniref:hypothetical protein n=1 Tax=Herbiconiux wuyangfengii TaxID=3342794 RepID=UPI0035BA0C31
MPHPSDIHTDEPTFDDLLWELDVTTARPEPVESSAPAHPVAARSASAEVSKASEPTEPAKPAKAPKPAKASKRGRFHRPELESRWERVLRNRVVQAVAGTALLAGTAVLVVVALGR